METERDKTCLALLFRDVVNRKIAILIILVNAVTLGEQEMIMKWWSMNKTRLLNKLTAQIFSRTGFDDTMDFIIDTIREETGLTAQYILSDDNSFCDFVMPNQGGFK